MFMKQKFQVRPPSHESSSSLPDGFKVYEDVIDSTWSKDC